MHAAHLITAVGHFDSMGIIEGHGSTLMRFAPTLLIVTAIIWPLSVGLLPFCRLSLPLSQWHYLLSICISKFCILCIGNWLCKYTSTHIQCERAVDFYVCWLCAPIMFISFQIMNGSINSKWKSKGHWIFFTATFTKTFFQLKYEYFPENYRTSSQANEMENGLEEYQHSTLSRDYSFQLEKFIFHSCSCLFVFILCAENKIKAEVAFSAILLASQTF